MGMEMVQPLWKTLWRLLKKLHLELPYDPAIPLFGICPREKKTDVHIKCVQGCSIAMIFIIAKKIKCPSNEWVNKMMYTYNTVYTHSYYYIGE